MTHGPARASTAADRALRGGPLRRATAWVGGVAVLALLATIRAGSGAEFAFTALALLPVMWSAWATGRMAGWVMAVLASATWIAGDLASEREFSTSWVPWFNGLVHGCTYGLVATLTAHLRELLGHEHAQATRDALTGLLNRRHFFEAGAVEVERSSRHGRPVAVLFLDLDHFKQLNDSRGHGVGDMALRAVGDALQRGARATDLVARMGGDEFAVLLPELSREGAALTARRVAAAVKAALAAYPGLSVSLGAAWFAGPAPPVDVMLKTADQLMYRVKQAGGGVEIGGADPTGPAVDG